MKKNALTILICLICLSITGYAQIQQHADPKMSKKEIAILIDSLDKSLHRLYVFQDKVNIMLAPVKKNFKGGVYTKIQTRPELASRLLKDLQSTYKDGHLDIQYYPELSEFLEAPLPDSIKQEQHERGLNGAKENNFGFKKTEILNGNIGYIKLDGFYPFVDEGKPTMDAAFRFVSHTKALIIDLRQNGGGSPDMVLQAQSYFLSDKTRMNDILDSKNDTLKRWTNPAVANFRLKMPVYILTSRNTFSGAEDFAYGLQQINRAVTVGDTTGGGAHPSGDFSLGQGFIIRIPTHRSCNPVSKTDWEGTGVRPDIAVASDQAFTKAQVTIFTELLSKATNAEEKQVFRWNITAMENKAKLAQQKGRINIAKDTLVKYCGDYRVSDPNERILPFSIVLKGDKLGRHFEDGYEDVLVPISTSTFVIDDESGRTLEFVKNGDLSELILSKQSGIYRMKKQ